MISRRRAAQILLLSQCGTNSGWRALRSSQAVTTAASPGLPRRLGTGARSTNRVSHVCLTPCFGRSFDRCWSRVAYLDQPRGLPGPQVGHRGSGADGRADRGSKRRADAQRGFALLGPTNVHRLDDYRCGIGPRAHKHLSNHVPDFSDEPVGRSAEVR